MLHVPSEPGERGLSYIQNTDGEIDRVKTRARREVKACFQISRVLCFSFEDLRRRKKKTASVTLEVF